MIKTKVPQLIAARIRAGYSQRELARAAGLSSGYMSQIERGEREPSPRMAKLVCEALGAKFDDFFEIQIGDGSDDLAAAAEVI